jgi:hypothetical protein
MGNILPAAGLLLASLALAGPASAAPMAPRAAGVMPDAGLQRVQSPYYWGGREHCWYPDGWRGPGWYWCGYRWRRGYGWGGPAGWNGWYWRGGPGPRYYDRWEGRRYRRW